MSDKSVGKKDQGAAAADDFYQKVTAMGHNSQKAACLIMVKASCSDFELCEAFLAAMSIRSPNAKVSLKLNYGR